MTGTIIGIDIGGTFIKGVVIESNEVKYKTTIETNDHQNQWKQATVRILEKLSSHTRLPIQAVGLAAPGITNPDNRSIFCMPGRLDGLEGLNWSEYLNQDVHVINDAHAALLAESKLGAAKNTANVVLLTLGTGVGGGLLINGALVQGYLHRAGHFGHIAIDSGSEAQDNTGIPGSLEDAVGEETLSQRTYGKYTSTRELVESYSQGEPWASYVWLSSLRKLALGLVSLCNAVSPDLVVLAGGITKAGDHLLKPLSTFMDLYEWRPNGESTPIRIAKFQEFAGAIGAGVFAESRVKIS